MPSFFEYIVLVLFVRVFSPLKALCFTFPAITPASVRTLPIMLLPFTIVVLVVIGTWMVAGVIISSLWTGILVRVLIMAELSISGVKVFVNELARN